MTEAQKARILKAGGTQDDIDAIEAGELEIDWEMI